MNGGADEWMHKRTNEQTDVELTNECMEKGRTE